MHNTDAECSSVNGRFSRSARDSPDTTILWFRRDLRLGDNPALLEAAERASRERGALLPVHVWEPRERRRWAPGAAGRWWLWHSLAALDADLRRRGSRLAVRQGNPRRVVPALASAAGASRVVWATGLDPEERADDDAVCAALQLSGIQPLIIPPAALLYDQARVLTRSGSPYTVFTPFWRACEARGDPGTPLPAPSHLPPPPREAGGTHREAVTLPVLRREAVRSWASEFAMAWQPGETGGHRRLDSFLEDELHRYAEERDYPSVEGTSRLSPHLHWGELSARQIWHGVAERMNEEGMQLGAERAPLPAAAGGTPKLLRSADAFIRQLGWREFAHHLLHHFPHTPEHPLKPGFATFPWRDDPSGLAAWRSGKTGYTLVDAGMRQLLAIGWMHNRVRLVTASFLVKDLLLSWQTGQDWFWDTLVDADLADNVLGWQWVAGCGADAAPFFRIFNPVTQRRRYDAENVYVRRWLPSTAAGEPDAHGDRIVDHREARSRALAAFAAMREAQG